MRSPGAGETLNDATACSHQAAIRRGDTIRRLHGSSLAGKRVPGYPPGRAWSARDEVSRGNRMAPNRAGRGARVSRKPRIRKRPGPGRLGGMSQPGNRGIVGPGNRGSPETGFRGAPSLRGKSARIQNGQDPDLLGVVAHHGDMLGDLAQRPLAAARLIPGRGPGRLVTQHVAPAEPAALGGAAGLILSSLILRSWPNTVLAHTSILAEQLLR